MTNGPLPALDDVDLATYFRQAGFAGGALVLMTAISLGESGGDPDNVGDERLVDAKWGPSIGLAQIRSLWADRGTGRSRDPDALTDPAFNARSAFEISSQGSNFSPWSVFTSGAYRDYLDRAWAAVKGVDAPRTERQGLAGIEIPGLGSATDAIIDPLVGGLGRIALVSVLILGGVGLVLAGGWRASAGARARAAAAAETVPEPRAQMVAAAIKPKEPT